MRNKSTNSLLLASWVADEIIEGYQTWLRSQGYSDGTVQAYTGELCRFLSRSWRLGQMGDLVPDMIRYVSMDELGESTRKRRIAAMRSVAQYFGVEAPSALRFVPTNCAMVSSSPLVVSNERRRGGHLEVWKRDRAIALVAIHTGFSPSVIAELETHHIFIDRELVWLVHPRSGDYYPVTRHVRAALLDWLRVREQRSGAETVIFTNRRGLRLSVRTIQQGVRRAIEIGGTDVSCRSIRRAFVRLRRSSDRTVARVARYLTNAHTEGVASVVNHRELEYFWRVIGGTSTLRSSTG